MFIFKRSPASINKAKFTITENFFPFEPYFPVFRIKRKNESTIYFRFIAKTTTRVLDIKTK